VSRSRRSGACESVSNSSGWRLQLGRQRGDTCCVEAARKLAHRRPIVLWFGTLSTAVLAMALLAFSFHGLNQTRSSREAVLLHGASAVATITVVHQVGGEACAIVDAEFTDASGAKVELSNLGFSPGSSPAFEGDHLDIRYDSKRPTHAAPVGRSCGDPGGEWRYWLVGLAALGLLAADLAVWIIVRRQPSKSGAKDPVA